MDDKFTQEFYRLLRQHGRIMTRLHLLDANIRVLQELEHEDNTLHHKKKSVEVEHTRAQLQKDLAAAREQIWDLVTLMVARGDTADE